MTPPLRVAVVHYHWRRGGVTRVAAMAAAALKARGVRVAGLAGEPAPDDLPFPSVALPDLSYDPAGRVPDAGALADAAEDAARRLLDAPPDCWHIHNHHLGKNLALPVLAHELAGRGRRVLLQVHDFPEDGRPAQYRLLADGLGYGGIPPLYPDAPHVHYAALNGRDTGFLAAAGLPPARVHRLPNPVAVPADEGRIPDGLPDGPLTLYPTRAIRRKNLGELLYWAARAAAGQWFGATLAPENPAARPFYDRWVAVAERLKLPVAFNLAARPGADFGGLMRRAETLITTSVAEGFGLAFLEPWLAGRPLAGRDLPEITGDFRSEGVDLDHLYARLDIPLAWVGKDRFRRTLDGALAEARAAYGLPTGPAEAERAYAAAAIDGRVDYGRLDEPLQELVIDRLASSAEARDELGGGLPSIPANRVRENAERVRRSYNPAAYGPRLEDLYRTILQSPVGPVGEADGRAVLERFADPARFYLLRT